MAAYQLVFESTHALLQLSPEIKPENAPEIEKESGRILAEDKNLVISCRGIDSFSRPWLRSLMVLARALKERGHEARLIMASPALATQLQLQGLDRALKCAPGIKEALSELGVIKAAKLDVGFVHPFLEATIHTLKLVANVEVKPGRAYKKDPNERLLGDISGIVGIVSELYSGSLVLGFPEATFLKVASGMLGEVYTTITPDIADGVGELANIIYCRAKAKLNGLAYGLKSVIPSVIVGKGHSVGGSARGPVVVVQFESDAGSFHVEICLAT